MTLNKDIFINKISNYLRSYSHKYVLDKLNSIVSNKRIVVTGPGRSIIGSGNGDRIESYDLVVRLNHQWPIPSNLVPDLGTRMDVLFHCANGDYDCTLLDTDQFSLTKLVCYGLGIETKFLKRLCKRRNVDALSMESSKRRLWNLIGSDPNTGTYALWMLLQTQLTELYVTGISFYTEPYYSGYDGHGAAPQHWEGNKLPSRIWNHNFTAQRKFAAAFVRDPRFHPDETLKRALMSCGEGVNDIQQSA